MSGFPLLVNFYHLLMQLSNYNFRLGLTTLEIDTRGHYPTDFCLKPLALTRLLQVSVTGRMFDFQDSLEYCAYYAVYYGADQIYIRGIEISDISSTAGMWHPLAGLTDVSPGYSSEGLLIATETPVLSARTFG